MAPAQDDLDFVRDTSPRALEVFYEIQRNREPGKKLLDTFDLSEGLFNRQRAGVKLRFPEAPEREIFLRTLSLRMSRDLLIRAYGWDSEEDV